MKLRIGTRKSRLAMVQTEMVRDAISRSFPDIEMELVPISTKGDRMLDRSLTSFGGKGVFTKELERALLEGKIDLAVHSAKDMPMELPEGLAVGAVMERGAAGDVLLTTSGCSLRQLPAGSVIGTSSLRRQLQLLQLNPQLRVRLLRGNVQTRIGKLQAGEYDGIVLAAAGLERLGLLEDSQSARRTAAHGGEAAAPKERLLGEGMEEIFAERLDVEQFVPAAGQGILTVEIRQGELSAVMERIHAPEAAACLLAERQFLGILGGSCNAPCGAYCRRENGRLTMTVMYARDGVHPIFRRETEETNLPGGEQETTLLGGEQERTEMTAAETLAGNLACQVRFRPVYLVGAGPGNGGLLTRRGLACLRQADAVVYDNLVSGSILNEAPLGAQLIYAGKRAGQHAMKQEEINELLIALAREGKSVVRLKGGDPFVFGRGGEEALALAQCGIPYEIVPGVSSAYSVPAYAGIPVTHRGISSSFHVLTGHEEEKRGGKALNYQILAQEEGTLVFLMGLGRLSEIAARLMEGGKAPETPAAVIQWGTTTRQRTVVSDLAHIAERAEQEKLQTPAVTLVGSVAGLSACLSWFGGGPLSGKRVLATGTRHFVKELEEALEPLGAETVAVSLIECRPLWSRSAEEAFARLEEYQWLVFTSSNGVEIFFETMKQRKLDVRRLGGIRFAVIGRKTADALRQYGYVCDFVPESYSGEDLAREWIPTLKPETRVLLMRARDGSPVLPERLKAAGVLFTDVPLYETWVDERRRGELNRLIGQVDYVAVASGSAARALGGMLEQKEEKEAAPRFISIGPTTTRAAQAAGLEVYADAVEYTAAGIAAVILADAEAENGNGGRALSGKRETPTSEQAARREQAAWEEQNARREQAAWEEQAARREQAACLEPDKSEKGEEACFPFFAHLTGRRVLVVGAGTVASRRAEVLAGFGACVQVVAPAGIQQMGRLEQEGQVCWIRRTFLEMDLDGAELVVTATDDADLNRRVVQQCRRRRIPVNNAGDKSQCDFYFPGIVRRGNVTLGICASGQDHKQVRELGEKLRKWMETEGEKRT